MDKNRTIAYHGSPHWKQILEQGLLARKSGGCPHIWLAVRPEDAAAFGVVLEVDMSGLDFGWMYVDEPAYRPYWQGCYHGGDIDPKRITLFKSASFA